MNEQPLNLTPPPLPSTATPPPPPPPSPPPPPPRRGGGGGSGVGFAWGCLTSLLLLMAAAAGLVLAVTVLVGQTFESVQTMASGSLAEPFGRSKTEDASSRIRRRLVAAGEGEREIAVIAVKGVIMNASPYDQASAERIASELDYARRTPAIAAVILDMDTPGGEVVASDEILQQVKLCRAAGKPVVTCIRSLGASGGYYIASGSDWIIANRMSMTGSVGVLIGTVRLNRMLEKIGVSAETYRSGSMKDMLSPTGVASDTEKRHVQALVDQTFHEFCQVVADGREAYADVDAVRQAVFADGRVVSGAEALQLGLVDELGSLPEAIARTRSLADVPKAPVVALNAAPGLLDLLRSMRSSPTRIRLDGVTPTALFTPIPGRLYYLAPDCY